MLNNIGNMLLIIIVMVIVWIMFSYSIIYTLKKRVKILMNDINNEIKKRHDMVLKIINDIKEKKIIDDGLIEKILSKNEILVNNKKMVSEIEAAESDLSEEIKNIVLLIKDNADLINSMLEFQKGLPVIEDRINNLRKSYNDSAERFNSNYNKYPFNMIMFFFDYQKIDYFRI